LGAAHICSWLTQTRWNGKPCEPGVNASGGAGILATQFVTEPSSGCRLSGDFGPNAFER